MVDVMRRVMEAGRRMTKKKEWTMEKVWRRSELKWNLLSIEDEKYCDSDEGLVTWAQSANFVGNFCPLVFGIFSKRILTDILGFFLKYIE